MPGHLPPAPAPAPHVVPRERLDRVWTECIDPGMCVKMCKNVIYFILMARMATNKSAWSNRILQPPSHESLPPPAMSHHPHDHMSHAPLLPPPPPHLCRYVSSVRGAS